MNIPEITAKARATIRALFEKYGHLGNFPAAAKALFQQTRVATVAPSARADKPVIGERLHDKPTTPPPALIAPEITLSAAGAVLGFKASALGAISFAEFRQQVRQRLSSRASEKMTELGFPAVDAALFPSAAVPARAGDSSEPPPVDSLSARLSFLAAELRCSTDELRTKDSEQLRALVEQRIGCDALDGVAQMGLPISALPPSRGAGDYDGDDLEGIQQQLAHTKDPVEAGRLAAKANAIRERRWSSASAAR